jgi:FkbM family methyltransferase
LLRHISINGCSNVFVEPLALGDHAGEADLFLVEGRQDWCNSLRPPKVDERTCTVRVEVRPLDDVLRVLGVSRVDFIKLDVEGAELSFLHGASKLLQSVAGDSCRGAGYSHPPLGVSGARDYPVSCIRGLSVVCAGRG